MLKRKTLVDAQLAERRRERREDGTQGRAGTNGHVAESGRLRPGAAAS